VLAIDIVLVVRVTGLCQPVGARLTHRHRFEKVRDLAELTQSGGGCRVGRLDIRPTGPRLGNTCAATAVQ
jgi:hypothetical protein